MYKHRWIGENGNEFVETPFEIYEVNPQTRIVVKGSEKPKKLRDVFEYVKGELPKYGIDLDEYDYLMPQKDYGYGAVTYWPLDHEYRWIACFAVKGGSEGYYVHVEAVVDKEDRQLMHLILGKTLQEGRVGMEHALKLSNALALILEAQI